MAQQGQRVGMAGQGSRRMAEQGRRVGMAEQGRRVGMAEQGRRVGMAEQGQRVGRSGIGDVSAHVTLTRWRRRSRCSPLRIAPACPPGRCSSPSRRPAPSRLPADLRQVATALQWGAAEAEAWASVGPPWAPAARVISLAHAGGVPPGPLLTAASDDLHRAELDRLEMSAARVGVRLVAPLGLVLLPAFCLTTVVPLVVALGRQLLVG